MGKRPPRPDREILEYYERGKERDRLDAARGGAPLERERTREVLGRHLPHPPPPWWTWVVAQGFTPCGSHRSATSYICATRWPCTSSRPKPTRERGLGLASLEGFDFRAMPRLVRPHVIGIAGRPDGRP